LEFVIEQGVTMKGHGVAFIWTVLTFGLGYGWQQSLADTASEQKGSTPESAVSAGANTKNASEVAPGPMETDRKMIAHMIEDAKNKGIGVGAYQGLFKNIEDKVRSGAPQTDVEPLITRLSDSLNVQLRHLEKPKPQASTANSPKAPIASSAKPASTANASSFATQPITGKYPLPAFTGPNAGDERRAAIVKRREQILADYHAGKIEQQEMDRELSKDGRPIMSRVFTSKAQAEQFARRQNAIGRHVTFKRI
jgi:hypothetical protein